MPVHVVGVSGATCSGKTMICERLRTSGRYLCDLVSMDNFYFPSSSDQHVRLPEFNNYANYEDLSSVDWEALIRDVQAKMAQLEASGNPGKTKLLLIEGILVLNQLQVDQLCHLRVFIRLDDRVEFLRRRSFREYEDDPVPEDYDEIVTWPMYEKNSAHLAGRRDIVFLNGANAPEEVYREFCARLDSFVQQAAGLELLD